MMELLGGAGLGGITGLVGLIIQHVMAYFKGSQEHQQKQENNAHELAVMKLEIESRDKAVVVQAESVGRQTDMEMFKASVASDTPQYSVAAMDDLEKLAEKFENARQYMVLGSFLLVLVDVSRGGIRPWATALLVFAVIGMAVMGNPEAVTATVYLATTALTWWFGARATVTK